jgi:putative hemolysin
MAVANIQLRWNPTNGGNMQGMLMLPFRIKFKGFRNKVSIFIERGNYIVKTIDDALELEQALSLRYRVFYGELLEKRRMVPLDMDKYDMHCDHLAVIDRRSNEVVGTYRLNLPSNAKRFYSAGEFEMENIIRLPGRKLELGRACISREHRNGVTISLLWRGIKAYISATGADWVFGCSSVKAKSYSDINSLHIALRKTHYTEEGHRVFPLKKYQFAGIEIQDDNAPKKQEEPAAVPSLLSAYLKSGARIAGDPAYDRVFKCADFFTLIRTRDMINSVEREAVS